MTIDIRRLRGRFAQQTTKAVLTIPSIRLVAAPSIVSRLRALQWSLIGLTVLSVGLIGWWWQETQEVDAIAERYETAALRTETLNRQFETQLAREGLTLPGDQIALVQGKIAFANLLSEKRAFSWTRLLSELEETVPANVSIGSVKLDFQQSSIVVDGLARSLQDVNVFVQTLQTHQAFQKAVLAKHDVHKGRDGGAAMTIEGGADAPHHDIEFTLAVDYRAAIMNGSMGE
jgi:Fimbrial assembly protein (PilN)